MDGFLKDWPARDPFDLALRRLGAVAELIGMPAFDRALYTWVAALCPVNVLFAIEVFTDSRPGRVLITEGHDEDITRRARRISRDYAVEDYRQDEVLNAHRAAPGEGVDMVVQQGRDHQDYFRLKYFDSMGCPQEVSAFRSDGPVTHYLGLSSMGAGYGATDLDYLMRALPLLFGMIVRHGQLSATGRDIRNVRRAQMERLLRRHCAALTQRELEVCAMIVTGHRAEAIGSLLGISAHTVATHRKNAYAKLEISGQSELFGILFAGWSDL
jgi:DNA-binding CsgD family transcriptional regulator